MARADQIGSDPAAMGGGGAGGGVGQGGLHNKQPNILMTQPAAQLTRH